MGDSFYCKTFPEIKQTTQRRLQQSKSCVFFFFSFEASCHWARADWCQKHPVKQQLATVSGVCLWLISTCRQAAGRTGSGREGPVVTREELCADTRQCRVVVMKTRYQWNLLEMGHLVANIGCCWLDMVHTWAPLWGSCWSGERRMFQMHSKGILTLWKSQMIGNNLVVFIQI